MSCNGCRVLRKGCSETCILRPSLQWIDGAEAQGHATLFVAKFFGRAGLMSFISAVSESQRPALFQSLLFEACGRTVNPVNGAVGLLWTGNWHICQSAVETVLRGGAPRPIPEILAGPPFLDCDEASEPEVACTDMRITGDPRSNSRSETVSKRKLSEDVSILPMADLDLRLTPATTFTVYPTGKLQPETLSVNSEESVTTTSFCEHHPQGSQSKLLDLFV